MERPSHFDLADLERQARAGLASTSAAMRKRNLERGVPDTLTELQEIMGEIVVRGSVAMADAHNRGHDSRLTALALGIALGSVARSFGASFDQDAWSGPELLRGFEAGLTGVMPGSGGIESVVSVAPTSGGNA